jgi:hypothetical protein
VSNFFKLSNIFTNYMYIWIILNVTHTHYIPAIGPSSDDSHGERYRLLDNIDHSHWETEFCSSDWTMRHVFRDEDLTQESYIWIESLLPSPWVCLVKRRRIRSRTCSLADSSLCNMSCPDCRHGLRGSIQCSNYGACPICRKKVKADNYYI